MDLKSRQKYRQLREILRHLSKKELSELRKEIDELAEGKNEEKKEVFRKLLLRGPVMSPTQIAKISKVRERINKWRVK